MEYLLSEEINFKTRKDISSSDALIADRNSKQCQTPK